MKNFAQNDFFRGFQKPVHVAASGFQKLSFIILTAFCKMVELGNVIINSALKSIFYTI
jgi:hypothetical protein